MNERNGENWSPKEDPRPVGSVDMPTKWSTATGVGNRRDFFHTRVPPQSYDKCNCTSMS
jgi:hypothetical protein